MRESRCTICPFPRDVKHGALCRGKDDEREGMALFPLFGSELFGRAPKWVWSCLRVSENQSIGGADPLGERVHVQPFNPHAIEDVVPPWHPIEVEGGNDENMVSDVACMAVSPHRSPSDLWKPAAADNLSTCALNLTCGVFHA
jgi:hypothetical protein